MIKINKKNSVSNDGKLEMQPGDELLSMTPNNSFFFRQDYSGPVAVGARNGKLVIEAIDKSLIGAFITGLKLPNFSIAGNEDDGGSEEFVCSVHISSHRLNLEIKDGLVNVTSEEFERIPGMVKDSSITGMLPEVIDVVIVYRYKGVTTVQHFQVTLEEILPILEIRIS